jgi:type I restriction enzyme, S subunit
VKDLLENVISGEWGKDPIDGKGVKVIRTTNFTNIGEINLEKEVVIRDIDSIKVENKQLQYGDIIIEKSGGSPEQPVGRVVFFDIDDKQTYLCNNFTSILRPNNNLVDSKFLFYYLFYQYKIRTVLKFQNKTTGIINLKLENYLKNINISLPSIEEQKRIVYILDTTSSLIDKRNKQIRALYDLIQSVFVEMFGDPFTNPKKWPLKRLGNKINITGGFAFKSSDFVDEGTPIIRIGTVNKGFFDNDTLTFVPKITEKYSKYLIKPGDLLITLTGTVGKEDYGNVCVVPNDYNEYLLNQRVAKMEPLDDLTITYLKYCFNQKKFKREITKLSRGVRQANISNDDIKNLRIPLPPLDLQGQFSEIENEIQIQIKMAENSLHLLKNSFGSILHRAFKGELLTV